MRLFLLMFLVLSACTGGGVGGPDEMGVAGAGGSMELDGSAGGQSIGDGGTEDAGGGRGGSGGSGGATVISPVGDGGTGGGDGGTGGDAGGTGGVDAGPGGDCAEGDTRPCGMSNVGECMFGTETCSGGVWGACEGAVGPTAEVCESGFDEDCDGVDEACVCAPGGCNDGNVCTIDTCGMDGQCAHEVDEGNPDCIGEAGQPCLPGGNDIDGYKCDKARLLCNTDTFICEPCGQLGGPCCIDGYGDTFCDTGTCAFGLDTCQ